MTIHLRILSSPVPTDLGAALGACRVGFAEIVGCWGDGPVAWVVVMGDWCEGME